MKLLQLTMANQNPRYKAVRVFVDPNRIEALYDFEKDIGYKSPSASRLVTFSGVNMELQETVDQILKMVDDADARRA